eukprot:snap_masked-scaffold_4-processed-gene-9.35-mRNA-1 protein AED:1.00 eAED:1.00 QI:0/0/0/0/1/1/2/0/67
MEEFKEKHLIYVSKSKLTFEFFSTRGSRHYKSSFSKRISSDTVKKLLKIENNKEEHSFKQKLNTHEK